MIAMAIDPSTSDWKLNAIARGLAYMTRDGMHLVAPVLVIV
jgi:hypothetical protein